MTGEGLAARAIDVRIAGAGVVRLGPGDEDVADDSVDADAARRAPAEIDGVAGVGGLHGLDDPADGGARGGAVAVAGQLRRNGEAMREVRRIHRRPAERGDAE